MASVSIQFSHPQLPSGSRAVTLTVPDAKLIEFADNLIEYKYKGQGVDGADLTRVQAIDKLMNSTLDGYKQLYRRTKADALKESNLPDPGDLDA